MKPFLTRWFVTTLSVFLVAKIMRGISYGGDLGTLIGASLLLGIVNAFVRPILLLLSLPLILVTMGFFILVVNALMLELVGKLNIGFTVDSFWTAFFGSILISIVSWALSAFFKGSDGKVHVLTHHSQIKQVSGRVIDV
jgi:putative membrane protein